MKIEFVSDVVCPWCAIGLASLEEAIARLPPSTAIDVHVEPFELNPHMEPEGESIVEHLSRKYGISAEQVARNRDVIAERGDAVGFRFGPRERTYNTFDAHRLLHWARDAGAPGSQLALKRALLAAYHRDGENVSDHAVLARVAESVGLDGAQARAVLASDAHAEAVREREQLYQTQGISSVPAVIIDERYLISGGQPPEVFEEALREILAEAQADLSVDRAAS